MLNFLLCLDLLLGVLSSEDVSASGEALLYSVGSLKFLSGNSAILRLLLDKNCLCVAQKLIQRLCIVEDTYLTIAGHILVQVCHKLNTAVKGWCIRYSLLGKLFNV